MKLLCPCRMFYECAEDADRAATEKQGRSIGSLRHSCGKTCVNFRHEIDSLSNGDLRLLRTSQNLSILLRQG